MKILTEKINNLPSLNQKDLGSFNVKGIKYCSKPEVKRVVFSNVVKSKTYITKHKIVLEKILETKEVYILENINNNKLGTIKGFSFNVSILGEKK